MTDTLIDGIETDQIPADDRGLLYGDHLFETIAFHRGTAPLWDRHWQRLERDSRRLGLPLPDPDLLGEECRRMADRIASCVIRVTLTRGSGGRAYQPPASPRPRRIVQRRDWPGNLGAQREHGLAAITSSIRLASGSALAGMKHGNRLEQVLAAREAHEAGVDEALVQDASGWLVEGVSSNVVVVIDGQALAPLTDKAGVAGVGLGWLADRPDVDIEMTRLASTEIGRAEEVMVINSVAGIRPIIWLDGRRLSAGPTCRQWQRLWQQELEG